MNDTELIELTMNASKVFTPAAPIDEKQLFAGRLEQLNSVIDVINQKGQHAIIFGERGVGKTSLANVITKLMSMGTLAIRVNADSTDTYPSLWKKIFSEITYTQNVRTPGFTGDVSSIMKSVADRFHEDITTDNVRQTLSQISLQQNSPIIIVIDEFDRITETAIKSAMADTIKTLSDHAVGATIILVGVADSVEQLIKEHQSIERALVQIKMPRMSETELNAIIDMGLNILKMTIDNDAKKQITLLSQGLPHYIHLLCLHSVRQSLNDRVMNITTKHVVSAIAISIQQAQQTTISAYHKAIMSPRKDNIFAQVLLACALSRLDSMGYFAAADVRKPLSAIMKRKYEIASFARHLNEFCNMERGPILKKIGKKHSYRFRFINPLMPPFIAMHGFANKLIDNEKMEALSR